MPYLAFHLNDVNEFVFDILEERLSIGRDAKNDIVIDNTYISGSHAEFLRKPDGVYELIDLKSANGTFVNGQRIQRSLIKGGDKIRFGQLDARFREQAPKGTAPASGSKPSSQPKAGSAPLDGRRGDTEPKSDTSPIESARSLQTLREGAAAGSLPIAKSSSATLEPALLKQREKLAIEVRRLRQERDLLRSETENQIRLREEVRAMESSLDERRKEAQAADARLAETRAATMDCANRYSIINSAADARLAETRAAIATAQAEAEKLALKKRDVADLDSQIESNRTQLSKVQTDIEAANTAFQSLHTDADKALNDRLKAEQQLADLQMQIQQHEAKSSELDATFVTAQKQKQSDLAALEAQIQVHQAEKEQLDKTLAELGQQNQQLQAQATDLTNRLDDLAGIDVKLTEANVALKAVESNKTELAAAISQMVVVRDSLEREILSSTEKSRAQNTLLQTLTLRCETVDAEVRSSEEQQASLSAEISKAQESLRATETTLETRKQELTAAESRAAQFTQQAEESVRQQTQIQQDIAQVRGELAKERTELQQIRTDTQNAMKAAAEAEATHARHSSQAVAMQTQISDLETLLATLLISETDRQTNLLALEAEQRRCEEDFNLRELEVSKADAHLAELKSQTANYESRLSELASMEKKLAETKADWIAAGQELESLKVKAERLQTERVDHEKRLPELQTELVNAQNELKTQLSELETSQASAKELAKRVSALEAHETQLLEAEKRQQASLSAEISKAQESLRATETTLETRKQELTAAESRAAQFTQQAEESVRQQTQIQQDIAQVRGELAKERTELQQIRTDTQNAMKAAAEAEATHARHSSQAVAMQTQISDLETLLATLLISETDRQTNLLALEAEQRRCEEDFNLRELEVSKADAHLAELKSQTANYESRLSELASMEKKLAETKADWIAAGQELESLKVKAERLQTERVDHEKRLPELQTELVNAQNELKTQLSELETSQASAKELAERVSTLEAHETQLLETEKRLEEVRRDLALQMTERDGVSTLVLTLLSQRAEYENLLPKLRYDVEVLQTELQTLTLDKNSMMVALEGVQADRHAALEQTESLRAESANLQKRLTDKIETLEVEIKARLAETNQAEARLVEITTKVAASEKRVSDLAVAQEQLTETQNALNETEARRHAEEKALIELVKQQDGLRNELITLEDGIRAGTSQVIDLTKKIKSEEARSADASSRLETATTALHTTETKRAEAEAAAAKIRDEERALRKAIPALNTEVAGLQATLSKLTRERDEASHCVTRLNINTEEGNKRIASLQQQISLLEEAQRVHEEQVTKSQAEADLEAGRLKAAQEKTRTAENSLQDIEREVKEIRLEVDATRTQLTGLESDLGARLDRIETLKLEEDRLLKELAERQNTIASAESVLAELRDKTHQEEKRVSEFTHTGDQILSFAASLADLESRQEETARGLREASERDFALQMKINTLQETFNREAARVEEIKQERLRVEIAFNTFNDIAQKQKASMQFIEAEQRKRLAEVERKL